MLFCVNHFIQHFTLKKDHNPQQLLFRLDPTDQSALNKKLKTSISALKELKRKLSSYTKSIIKQILNLQSSAINELNKLINNYQTIFITQEFIDLDEPKKILKTEIIIKDFSCEGLISQINEIFQKDLVDLDADKDKKQL